MLRSQVKKKTQMKKILYEEKPQMKKKPTNEEKPQMKKNHK